MDTTCLYNQLLAGYTGMDTTCLYNQLLAGYTGMDTTCLYNQLLAGYTGGLYQSDRRSSSVSSFCITARTGRLFMGTCWVYNAETLISHPWIIVHVYSLGPTLRLLDIIYFLRGRSQLSTFMKAYTAYARGEGVWDHRTLSPENQHLFVITDNEL